MSPTPWRTALITGASSGIGAALARELAGRGVEVVLAARREPSLAQLVDELREAGGAARALPLDVARADETVARIRAVDDELGGLDLVVANAGIGWPQPASQLTWEASRELFATNFTGAVATLTAVLPRMVERARGHLVGVSSVAVYSPTPQGSAYRGSKAGLTAFLENLRAELGASGVRVTAVHPGFVRTPMAEAFAIQPPFVLEADDAARRVVRRLARAPARIDFPWPVVFMMKLLGALPAALRDPMIRRVELGASGGRR
ncbi:MAG: SDR family NAD(P)-dependent oxidoreductase [Sandaracinaceae bacterium]|nr:SDR family NAD(P)-dependent oxidoreductase [Sandaracinaceae bacterium]